MEFTKHALVRARQRGFNQDQIYLICDYGITIKRPGHAQELFLRKKDLEIIMQNETDPKIVGQLRKNRDKLGRKRVLVLENNQILTVYNRTKVRRHYD